MKELLAKGMFDVATSLERVDVLLREWEAPVKVDWAPAEALSGSLRHYLSRVYGVVAQAAHLIEVPVTGIAAERARKRLLARKDPVTFAELKTINDGVKSRFEDELETIKFYCLAKGVDRYYDPSEPLFGSEVAARISKASDDISEAGKCFAVGRYTASVFHLMRAMEAAVQELSGHLGIEKLEREWGKLLSDIRAKIEAMPRGRERDDWSEVHANLYHVKQAWRNDTMHPKATYTEEEAREVFDATKAFMGNLAALLPPSPEEVIG